MPTEEVRRLVARALRLPPEARAAIASELLESLDDEIDADAEVAWARVVADRAREIDGGRVDTLPWSEVRERLLGGE